MKRDLDAFIENEVNATTSLKEGPFKSFLVELNKIQNDFDINECPIRTALVTARSAPSDKRVIKTLREWGVRIDESLFLGGMSKNIFLNLLMQISFLMIKKNISWTLLKQPHLDMFHME